MREEIARERARKGNGMPVASQVDKRDLGLGQVALVRLSRLLQLSFQESYLSPCSLKPLHSTSHPSASLPPFPSFTLPRFPASFHLRPSTDLGGGLNFTADRHLLHPPHRPMASCLPVSRFAHFWGHPGARYISPSICPCYPGAGSRWVPTRVPAVSNVNVQHLDGAAFPISRYRP